MAFRNELLLEWQKREYITSAAKAAKIIGVSGTFYRGMLNGTKRPGIDTLEKISAKTGYSVAELLDRKNKNRSVGKEGDSDDREQWQSKYHYYERR